MSDIFLRHPEKDRKKVPLPHEKLTIRPANPGRFWRRNPHPVERDSGRVEQQHEIVEACGNMTMHDARQELSTPSRAGEQVRARVVASPQPVVHKFDRMRLQPRRFTSRSLRRILRVGPVCGGTGATEHFGERSICTRYVLSRCHWVILVDSETQRVTLEQYVIYQVTYWRQFQVAVQAATMSTYSEFSSYTPLLSKDSWTKVRPFAVEIIATRCAHMTEHQRYEHQRSLAYFGDWVVQTGMVPLDGALRSDVIDVYTVDRAREISPVVAERERKMLRALAGIPPTVEKRRVTTSSEPERPYTDAELVLFHSWATHQPTEALQRACLAIFVLGAGCGFTSAEALSVRGTDLIEVDGVLAARAQRDGRIVPVLERWHDCMERLRATASVELVIAPDSRERKSALRAVLDRSIGERKPTLARLRVTWLVTHLDAGTPLAALLPASGMTSTDSLRRAMKYVRALDLQQRMAALRLKESGR